MPDPNSILPSCGTASVKAARILAVMTAAALLLELLLAVSALTLPPSWASWIQARGIAWAPSFQCLASLSPDTAQTASYLFATVLTFPLKVGLAATILGQLPPKIYAQFIISPRHRSRTSVVEYIAGAPLQDQTPLNPYRGVRLALCSTFELLFVVMVCVRLVFALDGQEPPAFTPISRAVVAGFREGGGTGLWVLWSAIEIGFAALAVAVGGLVLRDWIEFGVGNCRAAFRGGT